MPGDPKACRDQARGCLQLAHTARTAAGGAANIHHWLQLCLIVGKRGLCKLRPPPLPTKKAALVTRYQLTFRGVACSDYFGPNRSLP